MYKAPDIKYKLLKNPPNIQESSCLTPHGIPELELLNHLVFLLRRSNIVNFSNTVFVGVQHILETTASLFKSLIDLGAKPEKMFFTGKFYSTSPEVALAVKSLGIQLLPDEIPTQVGKYQEACRFGLRKLWGMVEKYVDVHDEIETIIVVDDGGRCLEEMSHYLKFKYKVAALEQTRAGLYSEIVNALPFPLIETASSACKRMLEAPLIATAIFDVIKKFIEVNFSLEQKTVYGVIGNGYIGSAIVTFLLARGYFVNVYDKAENAFSSCAQSSNFARMNDPQSVIANSEVIFACVGNDWTKGMNNIGAWCTNKKKIFINCASENRGFESLLIELAKDPRFANQNVLSDLLFQSPSGCDVVFLNGAFPINFDRKPWNVPARDIDMTQCLMLVGIVQAGFFAAKPVRDGYTIVKTEHHSLDPYAQSRIAHLWLMRQENKLRYDKRLTDDFKNIEFITKNSGGLYVSSPLRSVFEMAIDQLPRLSINMVSLFPDGGNSERTFLHQKRNQHNDSELKRSKSTEF